MKKKISLDLLILKRKKEIQKVLKRGGQKRKTEHIEVEVIQKGLDLNREIVSKIRVVDFY